MRTLLIVITSIALTACSSEEPAAETTAETPAETTAVASPPKEAPLEVAPTPAAPAASATSAPDKATPPTVAGALAGERPAAETRPAIDRGLVVVRVLGHPIYSNQIEINKETMEALKQATGPAAALADERIEKLRQMRLNARVVNPLIEAEIARRTLTPSMEDIDAVLAWGRRNLESRLEAAQAELDDPATTPARRAVLERQIQYNQRELENSTANWTDSDDPRHQQRRSFAMEVAKQSIERWRLQKLLHAEFGGPVTIARVGPPQPTAPVAMRKWLAACIDRGDLVFEDEVLKQAFLDYQIADDPKQAQADETYFDVPWWEIDP